MGSIAAMARPGSCCMLPPAPKSANLRFSTWMPLPGAEKDKFVELFYDRHISQLLAALVAAGDTPYGPGAPAASTGAWCWPVVQWAATERMG